MDSNWYKLVFVFALIGWSSSLLSGSRQSAFAEEAIKKVEKVKETPPLVEQYFINGQFAKGEAALAKHVKQHPKDDQARLGLGTLQFVNSFLKIVKSFDKYGANGSAEIRNAFELPPPKQIEEIDDAKFRQILLTFFEDMKRTETTLAKVQSKDVKLRLRVGLFLSKTDARNEQKKLLKKVPIIGKLVKPVAVVAGPAVIEVSPAPEIIEEEKIEKAPVPEKIDESSVAFDQAELYFLRSVCHLLMAADQFVLSLDGKETFDRTGQVLFPRKKVTHPYLKPYPFSKPVAKQGENSDEKEGETPKPVQVQEDTSTDTTADTLAFFHLLHVDVKEPKRLESVSTHLVKAIQLSRDGLKSIQAETDDDEEFIAGQHQTGVEPSFKISNRIIEDWVLLFDEMELVLAGKRLLPHWRLKKEYGINAQKFFTDAKQIDPFLLIQGTDLKPFLDKGQMTDRRVWIQALKNIMGEEMLGMGGMGMLPMMFF